jgi:hypothetical protein
LAININPVFIELVFVEKEPYEKSEFGYIDGNLKSVHSSADLSFFGWWYDGSETMGERPARGCMWFEHYSLCSTHANAHTNVIFWVG